jgi:D-3-phosphoglycerate dehydrogenase
MNIRTPGRVLVTVAPFGERDRDPIELLEKHNIPFTINPKGRRLTEQELLELVQPYEVLLASTEPITERVLDAAPHLRLIARAGIGLDNVPLAAARARGIAVTYTPDAPTTAVAELTIGQMLASLRHTMAANRDMHQGVWQRRIGRSIHESTIGVIGVGRIGRSVIRRLRSLNPREILLNDLVRDDEFDEKSGCTWTDVDTILSRSDIVTLHLPLTPRTHRLIAERELMRMKNDAILINTSRGGIVDEAALARVMHARPAFVAAVDVFEHEPYSGNLKDIDNCLLTSHMGSATRDCRLRMELEAAEEVVRYFQGRPLSGIVPEYEYELQFSPTLSAEG